uniref:Uncharacterized protein n=1 Tax=Anopheles atroparvus TaxID=41427 RepID=A0A182IXF8_ANOAO
MKVFLCCALAMLAFVAIEAVPVAEEPVGLEDPSLEPQGIAPEEEIVAVYDDGEVAREKRHSRYGGGYDIAAVLEGTVEATVEDTEGMVEDMEGTAEVTEDMAEATEVIVVSIDCVQIYSL